LLVNRYYLVFYIVSRLLRVSPRRFTITTWVSIVGITLGVGCMVAAMAGFSGFETTLRKAMTDSVGHVIVMKRGEKIDDFEALAAQIRSSVPEVEAITPVSQLEAIIAGQGKVSFVLLMGVDPASVDSVLNLDQRLIAGKTMAAQGGEISQAMVGRGIAEQFGLQPGQTFQVVLPNPARFDSAQFSPKVKKFVVAGILDLGKHDFNERYIVTTQADLQEFGGMEGRVSGLRLRLSSESLAPAVSSRLAQELGFPFWIVDWRELSHNLFSAIQLEKIVIFFIMLIMVVAASFNVSTTLYITVLRRYPDISIYKTMGLGPRDIRRIFQFYGLAIASIGIFLGLVFGVLLIALFLFLQDHFMILPPDVYKLGKIQPDFRFFDMVAIVVAAYVVCLLSTLAPARRGARLDPVEGLRYD
jgi:lipoprotein-releasing system permease protein